MITTATTEQELQLNLQNRIRCFLLEFDGIKTAVKGFTLDMHGDSEYCFEYPAMDWDSLMISGHSEMYYRKLSKENNWRSCIEFRRPQEGSLSIKDHKRFFTLILASVDDVPPDLADYFACQPEGMIVPLAVPIVDLTHTEMLENGEILEFSGRGVIAVYGPADDLGYLSAENNATTIKKAVLENPGRMNSHGIVSLDLGDIDAKMFPGMCEVSIGFTFSINLNMQEDHYWKPIY